MPDQVIQYTEEMVGAGHPTKGDTLNRALLVGHNADGTHKETSRLVGDLVQIVHTQTGNVISGTTTIPLDDTIPQKTEGNQIFTLAITPKSAEDILILDVNLYGCSGPGSYLSCALFQGEASDAIASSLPVYGSGGGGQAPIAIPLKHRIVAGTTNEIIFKVRAGLNSAGTFYLNGDYVGARKYGGSVSSSFTIWEVKG